MKSVTAAIFVLALFGSAAAYADVGVGVNVLGVGVGAHVGGAGAGVGIHGRNCHWRHGHRYCS